MRKFTTTLLLRDQTYKVYEGSKVDFIFVLEGQLLVELDGEQGKSEEVLKCGEYLDKDKISTFCK